MFENTSKKKIQLKITKNNNKKKPLQNKQANPTKQPNKNNNNKTKQQKKREKHIYNLICFLNSQHRKTDRIHISIFIPAEGLTSVNPHNGDFPVFCITYHPMFLLFCPFPFTGLSYDFTNPDDNCTTKWKKFNLPDDSIVQKSSKNVDEAAVQALLFLTKFCSRGFILLY